MKNKIKWTTSIDWKGHTQHDAEINGYSFTIRKHDDKRAWLVDYTKGDEGHRGLEMANTNEAKQFCVDFAN